MSLYLSLPARNQNAVLMPILLHHLVFVELFHQSFPHHPQQLQNLHLHFAHIGAAGFALEKM